MFGVSWGCDPATLKDRFAGLTPAAEDPALLAYPLPSVIDRLRTEGSFCPTTLIHAEDRLGDEASFGFGRAGLNAIEVEFSFEFERIGQDSDTLSDQAMAAFARTEFQRLLFELAARYGPHKTFAEQPMRIAKRHLVAVALFQMADATVLQASLGFDHSAMVGKLCYLPPVTNSAGI